jgi:hypothetical protein
MNPATGERGQGALNEWNILKRHPIEFRVAALLRSRPAGDRDGSADRSNNLPSNPPASPINCDCGAARTALDRVDSC